MPFSACPKSAVVALLALAGAGCLPGPLGVQTVHTETQAERAAAFGAWSRDHAASGGGASPAARASGALTLDDAIKVALQYNKTLQAALEEKGVVRGQRTQAYQVVLPTVAVTAGYTRWEDTARYAPTTPIDRYAAGFQITQPLYNAAMAPQLRGARLFEALVDEGIRAAVQETIRRVAIAYYGLALADEMVKVNQAAVESARAQLHDVQVRYDNEMALPFTLLRANVEVINAESGLLTQRNAADNARDALLLAMGVSQDSEIEVADRLEFLPMAPVFERAVEIAFSNRPDLIQAQMNVRMRLETMRITESAWWPSFAATVAQRYGKPGPATNANRWEHGALELGLGMTWAVGAADLLGRQRADAARVRQQAILLQDQQDRALQEIRSVMHDLRNAEELVNAQRWSRQAAEEALRLAIVSYQGGDGLDTDVIAARGALVTANGNYYQALYRHTTARLALQVAMGVLGPRPGASFGGVDAHPSARPALIGEFMTDPGQYPTTFTETDRQLEELLQKLPRPPGDGQGIGSAGPTALTPAMVRNRTPMESAEPLQAVYPAPTPAPLSAISMLPDASPSGPGRMDMR